jgi:hypothetical protein
MASAFKSGDKRIAMGIYVTETSPMETRAQEAAELVASVLGTAANGSGRLQFELLPNPEKKLLMMKVRGSPALINALSEVGRSRGWGIMLYGARLNADTEVKMYDPENAPAVVGATPRSFTPYPPRATVVHPNRPAMGTVSRLAQQVGAENMAAVAHELGIIKGKRRGPAFSAAVGAAMAALVAAANQPVAERKEIAFSVARERLASLVDPATNPSVLDTYARLAVDRAIAGNVNLVGGTRRRRTQRKRTTRRHR